VVDRHGRLPGLHLPLISPHQSRCRRAAARCRHGRSRLAKASAYPLTWVAETTGAARNHRSGRSPTAWHRLLLRAFAEPSRHAVIHPFSRPQPVAAPRPSRRAERVSRPSAGSPLRASCLWRGTGRGGVPC
jgi:hypothetical protein